jgi:hypothetical protein
VVFTLHVRILQANKQTNSDNYNTALTSTMICTTISIILLYVAILLFLLPRPVHTAAWSVEGNRYIRKKLPSTFKTSQETTFRFPDESKILHEDHYSTNKDMYTEEKLPNRDFLHLHRSEGRRNAHSGVAFLTNYDMVPSMTMPATTNMKDPPEPHHHSGEYEPPYHDLFHWF